MKAFSYVNGTLTVINESKKVVIPNTEKPEFIGNSFNFYYESALQQKDGEPLTYDDIENAELFIQNYVFPEATPIIDKQHCVNLFGEYVGVQYPSNIIIAIEALEHVPLENQIYDFTTKSFFNAVKVNEEGEIIPFFEPNFKCYLPSPNSMFASDLYKYNFDAKMWEIDFLSAKNFLIADLIKRYKSAMNFVGQDWMYKVSSREWYFQEKEATDYLNDNTTPTLFLDTLIQHRNRNETKEAMIEKILSKRNSFLTEYGILVGKSQIKVEAIDPSLYRLPEINKIREWFKLELISIFDTPDFQLGTYNDIIRDEIENLDKNPKCTTVFIDAILKGRADKKNKKAYIEKYRVILNETKQKTAMMLAKFQSVLKVIKSTNTIEELEMIKLDDLCPNH